jgi:large subunit ribosomal protein L1
MDKLANVHLAIGKRSFTPEQLVENGRAVVTALLRARPSTVKGRFVRRLTLSGTMGPGIPVSTEGLEDGAS